MPTTYNLHVDGLCRRVRRFIIEANKSTSSGLAHTSAADIGRLGSYLNAVEFYLDHIVAAPALDLPETSPYAYELPEMETLADPENEAILDFQRLLIRFEGEMMNSQSSRLSSGMVSHDEKRCRDMLTVCRNFLSEYVTNVQPMDLPETAPARASTGPGRTGV